MAKALEPLPGTSDLWEPEVLDWLVLEDAARAVFRGYGYGELRTPIFEKTDVFVRSIGTETEVVQKEMYSFEDRGGRRLTLRPEGTAGVMRAIANRGLAEGDERRVFYMGPMFRGERPAAGRRRQFHQIGVEAVGACQPALDAECIAMLMHYLAEIGIPDGRLLLNTRGTAADREHVCVALKAHFAPLVASMCDDCRRRIENNVWRILDCKEAACQEPIAGAPHMTDLIGPESSAFFAAVCAALGRLDIPFEVAPRLVRGLDYYQHTVFEVVHSGLGAQDALAGGGRYAIELPGGGKPVEGVGFAVGMERLLLARASRGVKHAEVPAADVFVVSPGGADVVIAGIALAQELRHRGLRVMAETAGRSMKAQMRTANKLGARVVLIQGDAEIARNMVFVKNMETSEQQEVGRAELGRWASDFLGCADA